VGLAFTGTQKVQAAAVSLGNPEMSAWAWVRNPTVDNGVFLESNSDFTFQFYWRTSGSVRITRRYDTTNGQWSVVAADHALTWAAWNFIAFTDEGVGTPPQFYCAPAGGQLAEIGNVQEVVAPAGAIHLDSSVLVNVGNNNAGTLANGGAMGFCGVSDTRLSLAELRSLMAGRRGATQPQLWLPLWLTSEAQDLSGHGRVSTLTGPPALAAGPPVGPLMPSAPGSQEAAATVETAPEATFEGAPEVLVDATLEPIYIEAAFELAATMRASVVTPTPQSDVLAQRRKALDGIPHLAFPLALTESGALGVLEQDTLADVRQCVYVLTRTPRGTRALAPTTGIPDPTFTSGVDPAELTATLEEQEDRARVRVVAAAPDGAGRQNPQVRVRLAAAEDPEDA